jgi:hypothetical protein
MKCIRPCIITALFLVGIISKLASQEWNKYPLKQNKVSAGITAGIFAVLYTDIELSVMLDRRISNSTVLEVRPLFGYLKQLYRGEGEDNPYEIIYAGTTIGCLRGKNRNYFEIELGTAYFTRYKDEIRTKLDQFLPIGAIGYRRVSKNLTFRTGVGFPQGMYVSFHF